jgi:hypothetical protein
VKSILQNILKNDEAEGFEIGRAYIEDCIQGFGGRTRRKETTRKTQLCTRVIVHGS